MLGMDRTACAANTRSLRGPGSGGDVTMVANMPDGDMMVTGPMDMDRNDPLLHDD